MSSKKIPKKKQKRIVLTEREIEKIKQEAVLEAIDVCASIPIVVLHDDFGFGKKRLDRFIERFAVHWSCIGDTCKLMDIVRLAEELSGAKIITELKG